MAFVTKADNYVRAINTAATIIAGQDTSQESVKDIIATVKKLSEGLYKLQNKFVEAEGFESEGPKSSYGKKSYSGSATQGSGSGGLTPKQRTTLGKAFDSLGDSTPYNLDDIEAAEGKERSDMIGHVFDAAWGGKS